MIYDDHQKLCEPSTNSTPKYALKRVCATRILLVYVSCAHRHNHTFVDAETSPEYTTIHTWTTLSARELEDRIMQPSCS